MGGARGNFRTRLTERMSKQLLSPEFLLLTCCARYQLEPRQQALLERLTARPLDWQRVLAQAEFHGVLQLMHCHVGRRGIGPDQVQEPMRVAARQTLARNMEFTAELGRLTEQLQTQGLRFLWFKGPVAAEMCGSDRDQALAWLERLETLTS